MGFADKLSELLLGTFSIGSVYAATNLIREKAEDEKLRESARQSGYTEYWSSTGRRSVATNARVHTSIEELTREGNKRIEEENRFIERRRERAKETIRRMNEDHERKINDPTDRSLETFGIVWSIDEEGNVIQLI